MPILPTARLEVECVTLRTGDQPGPPCVRLVSCDPGLDFEAPGMGDCHLSWEERLVFY